MRDVARCLDAVAAFQPAQTPCTPEHGSSRPTGAPPRQLGLTQHLLDAPLAEVPLGAGFENPFEGSAYFGGSAAALHSLHSPLLIGVQASMRGDVAARPAAEGRGPIAPAAAALCETSSNGTSGTQQAAPAAHAGSGAAAASLCCGLGPGKQLPRSRAEAALLRMQPEDFASPLQSGLRYGALSAEASPASLARGPARQVRCSRLRLACPLFSASHIASSLRKFCMPPHMTICCALGLQWAL